MKAQLKRKLSQVKDFDDPKISMEQYVTPPHLAADLVFTAYMQEDLEGEVVDLGAGTGILAIGAALLGAEVTAVEKDEEALEVAKDNAKELGVSEEIDFVLSDVRSFLESCDTVLMNPPFSQHSEEGLEFWETATTVGGKVYGISPASSREGIKSFIESSSHRVIEQLEFRIDLPATYGFHTQESRETLVDIIITEDKK